MERITSRELKRIAYSNDVVSQSILTAFITALRLSALGLKRRAALLQDARFTGIRTDRGDILGPRLIPHRCPRGSAFRTGRCGCCENVAFGD
jgi:hypothetical protein